jgi:cytochrome c oxidase subunit IV
MSEHIVQKRTYFTIFAILMCLTALTVIAAFQDLGRLNPIVALTIAVCKGTLVVLYFMHVRYSSRLTWVFAASGFVWLLILVALTLSDYMSRSWLVPPR